MRVSRAPEYRGGTGSPILIILVLLVVLIVGGVVIYLLLENNPAAAPVAPNSPAITQPIQPNTVPGSNPAPQVSMPTQPEQPPVSPQDTGMEQVGDQARFVPPPVDPQYGNPLYEGYLDFGLLSRPVRAWYSLRVNANTNINTLFLAFYDPVEGSLSRQVKVENFVQAGLIDNAELTVYYPNAPQRAIRFDRESGIMVSSRFFTARPYEPSIFSQQIRLSLIQQSLALQNQEVNTQAELGIDLTGLSDKEGIVVRQHNAVAVENALAEIQEIVDQIESRRPRS